MRQNTTNLELAWNDNFFLKKKWLMLRRTVIDLMMILCLITYLKIRTNYFLFNFSIQDLLVFVLFY